MFTVEHPAPAGRRHARGIAVAIASAAAIALGALAIAPVAQAAAVDPLAPVVTHTATGPTGYEVTFSYKDDSATRVQIKGEWYFERPSELDPAVGTASTPVVTQGYTPDEWEPGDVPITYPNSPSANWPVVDMVKDDATGVWTYTTPLPSGVFSYSLFVNCASDAGTGCTAIADPHNLPWNQDGTTVHGSKQLSSQVYVPSDPDFGTVDYSWMAPAAKQGTLTSVSYPSPGHVTPAGSNYAVVYTPPGYDADRADTYPTLYLAHGGGGNETDWTTQGAANDILDNLIASGEAKSTVVVMTNSNGYASSTFNDAYDQDVINNLIPYVEAHYNVSSSSKQRAFAGLSAGGIAANSFLLKYPDTFQYYDVMSAGLPPANETITQAQAAALRGKSITISSGLQDPIFASGFQTQHRGSMVEVNSLTSVGVPVTTTYVNGGHEWYVWRLLLKDFVTNNAILGGADEIAPVPVPTVTVTAAPGASAPAVTTQPATSVSVTSGALVTLTSIASGTPTPSVQWQVSHNGGSTWITVAGAKSTAYAFIATAAKSGDSYRAAFTNSAGTAYSHASTLSVKIVTKTAVSLADSSISPSKKAVVTIKVTPTTQKPTGTVTVHYGSTTKSVKLTASAKGVVKVTLPKLKKGSYRVSAVFNGSAGFAQSSSSKTTLKVR